jgi:hypothetical protein
MRSRGFAASLLLAALVLGCAQKEPARTAGRAQIGVPAESGFDLSSASVVGSGSLIQRGDGPNDLIETEATLEDQPQDLSGQPCTENCPGHEAGYQWAEQNSVADPNDCGGHSNSFFEGCMAYAHEQREDRDMRDE